MDCEPPFKPITTPNTTIISPNYPNPYDPDVDCQVTVNFHEKVSIVFEDFDLFDYGNCNYDSDWLEAHDGDSSESDMIGERLCGHDLPRPIESTGNSMTLVFHTDSKNQVFKGFKIKTY